jgi:hypothetical protein
LVRKGAAAAGATDAEELQPVVGDDEPVLLGHPPLEALDLVVLELDDPG